TTVIICSDHGFHPDHLRPVQLPKEPAGPAIEHRDLGTFIMAGPGIKRDQLIHGISLLDITPTILTLYGLPVGEDMDGKPLLEAFEAPPPVTTIPSWDAVPGDDGRLAAETCYDPIAAKAAMDQLVALGYVEAPGADREQAITNTVREMRYNLARSYMDGGRYAEGAEILADLYQSVPDQYRFGVHLASCYRATGRVAALRDLVEHMSEDRRRAAALARDRIPIFEAGVKVRQAEAGELTADGAMDLGRLSADERQEYNDLRLTARFSTFDLDFLMGWVLTAEGQPAAALEHLLRAGQADPHRPGLHIQVGEALVTLRRWPEAEQAFGRALAIDLLNPYAWLGLAKTCLRQKRVEEGMAAALESISHFYQNPMAHYVLALGLLRRRQFLQAAEAMRVAVSINPNFERAHRFLAGYYLRFELDTERSQAHWRLVRECRVRRRAEGRRSAELPTAAGVDGLAPEDGQEGRQLPFDAAPLAGMDRDAVPADPAQCVTVVAGLPRSGTSMMMQMLAAGGVAALTDGQREADGDNPRGYFELESATRLRRDQSWVAEARGKAVKIVAQL
ncbi:MAG TPA: tetratricopeptide repeat protein, partial [Lamprocystis sp. (in: g-proteobacteria)]|nr:tetratricopeptide repeat protein [Lamprocystis sp. (in: g-proteobacteria)]